MKAVYILSLTVGSIAFSVSAHAQGYQSVYGTNSSGNTYIRSQQEKDAERYNNANRNTYSSPGTNYNRSTNSSNESNLPGSSSYTAAPAAALTSFAADFADFGAVTKWPAWPQGKFDYGSMELSSLPESEGSSNYVTRYVLNAAANGGMQVAPPYSVQLPPSYVVYAECSRVNTITDRGFGLALGNEYFMISNEGKFRVVVYRPTSGRYDTVQEWTSNSAIRPFSRNVLKIEHIRDPRETSYSTTGETRFYINNTQVFSLYSDPVAPTPALYTYDAGYTYFWNFGAFGIDNFQDGTNPFLK